MAGKRKDNKGRVLKTGESQRPNGTYDYRYTDGNGQRKRIYAKTLDILRKKEETIQRDLMDGIDSDAGKITVMELVDKYMGLQRHFAENTRRAYSTAVKRIHNEDFGRRKVNKVKMSDAKAFLVKLHDDGLKFNTIGIYYNVLSPAFEMAVNDDCIRKNPFRFTLCEVISKDASVRQPLSKQQEKQYMDYLREHGDERYYNEIEILLQTGLRVSELYGLTLQDVDFSHRCIHITKQLCRTADTPYFVTDPKSKSGIRKIPMTDRAYMALQRAIHSRKQPKEEMLIDGCKGFIFLDKSGRPKAGMHLENYMRNFLRKVRKQYPDFPSVTPHVLRHTFCTNLQRTGIDAKSLQALMGHSNVSVTLDVYTHVDYTSVEEAFHKVAVNL